MEEAGCGDGTRHVHGRVRGFELGSPPLISLLSPAPLLRGGLRYLSRDFSRESNALCCSAESVLASCQHGCPYGRCGVDGEKHVRSWRCPERSGAQANMKRRRRCSSTERAYPGRHSCVVRAVPPQRTVRVLEAQVRARTSETCGGARRRRRMATAVKPPARCCSARIWRRKP